MRLSKAMTGYGKHSPERVAFAIQVKFNRSAWQKWADEMRKNSTFGTDYKRHSWDHVSWGIAESSFTAGIYLMENGEPREW